MDNNLQNRNNSDLNPAHPGCSVKSGSYLEYFTGLFKRQKTKDFSTESQEQQLTQEHFETISETESIIVKNENDIESLKREFHSLSVTNEQSSALETLQKLENILQLYKEIIAKNFEKQDTFIKDVKGKISSLQTEITSCQQEINIRRTQEKKNQEEINKKEGLSRYHKSMPEGKRDRLLIFVLTQDISNLKQKDQRKIALELSVFQRNYDAYERRLAFLQTSLQRSQAFRNRLQELQRVVESQLEEIQTERMKLQPSPLLEEVPEDFVTEELLDEVIDVPEPLPGISELREAELKGCVDRALQHLTQEPNKSTWKKEFEGKFSDDDCQFVDEYTSQLLKKEEITKNRKYIIYNAVYEKCPENQVKKKEIRKMAKQQLKIKARERWQLGDAEFRLYWSQPLLSCFKSGNDVFITDNREKLSSHFGSTLHWQHNQIKMVLQNIVEKSPKENKHNIEYLNSKECLKYLGYLENNTNNLAQSSSSNQLVPQWHLYDGLGEYGFLEYTGEERGNKKKGIYIFNNLDHFVMNFFYKDEELSNKRSIRTQFQNFFIKRDNDKMEANLRKTFKTKKIKNEAPLPSGWSVWTPPASGSLIED